MRRLALALAAALSLPSAAMAQAEICSVTTSRRLIGANDRVVVERYDDPKVANVSCYVSRAVTGGVTGSLGLAENPSRFSVACRALGPVSIPPRLPASEEAFSASAGILFKEITVHRMVDREKGVLTYLVVSARLIDGSPFNSLSVVPADAR